MVDTRSLLEGFLGGGSRGGGIGSLGGGSSGSSGGIGSLGRMTRANLEALALPGSVVEDITAAVTDSAGIVIAGLQAQPGSAALAEAAGSAMIHASRLTTGLACLALCVGLLATFRLPRSSAVAATEPEPESELDPRPG